MKKHLHIRTDDVEIEKVGDATRVIIRGIGTYDRFGDDYQFVPEHGVVYSETAALVIKKIVEAL